MASTAVSAMPHSLHHIPLPPVSRVRPPRMLPGTVSPNTDPQPSGPAPPNSVWVQGRWRNPSSNAAKHQTKISSLQLKKALRHKKHGLNIFAYYHIRTHQVVYSLSRILQSSQIMPQLLFFGKQTKPREIRTDHWRPYFSMHFPQTPAGARAGLTSYQRLRELAMRRQLSPDREALLMTQEDVDKWYGARDPVDTFVKMQDQRTKPPRVGQMLHMYGRAKRLMEQRASSVADAAFVLEKATEMMRILTVQDLKDRTRQKKKNELGWRGRKRLNAIRKEEGEKEEQIKERQYMPKGQEMEGTVGLDKDVAREIGLEYGGRVAYPKNRVNALEEFEEKVETLDEYEKRLEAIENAAEEEKQDLQDKLAEVQVLWADMRDGTYAEKWPETVLHAELAPEALTNVHGKSQWTPHVMARDGTVPRHEFLAGVKGREEFWNENREEWLEQWKELKRLQENLEWLEAHEKEDVAHLVKENELSLAAATQEYQRNCASTSAALERVKKEWERVPKVVETLLVKLDEVEEKLEEDVATVRNEMVVPVNEVEFDLGIEEETGAAEGDQVLKTQAVNGKKPERKKGYSGKRGEAKVEKIEGLANIKKLKIEKAARDEFVFSDFDVEAARRREVRPSTAGRVRSRDLEDDELDDVVQPQQRGLWGRVKGLLGR